jgi:hypothetical protein
MSNFSSVRVNIRALGAISVTTLLLGGMFQTAASAASVNGRCTKSGAKSGTLKCTKTKSGLRWTKAATAKAAVTTAPATAAPTTVAAGKTAPVTEAPAAPAAGITYSLKEWAIEGPATLKAGTVSMSVTNPSRNKHEMKIIKGTYAELPKAGNGAVEEEKLAAGAIVGKVDAFPGGETKPLTVELTPGTYLFVCNIAFGPASHAGKGQVLDVTVA